MESANYLFLIRKLDKYVKNHRAGSRASLCMKFIFASDFLFIYKKSLFIYL